MNERLRELPSVDELVNSIETRCPRELIVAEARRAIEQARARLLSGEAVDISRLREQVLAGLASLEQPSLRRVINATGVVLHTNLGRAPFAPVNPSTGYSNLEYDLATGARGKRDVHVAPLFERLIGKPGIVVNNNAAAIYLVLNELAAGREVIVSRGELIEIGEGFRIPDIMLRSGVLLREVGSTNRTHVDDYRNALSERTGLILRVHPSNFHVSGFTARPELRELAVLSRERGIPLYEDLGSGCVVDLKSYGITEPLVADSLDAGVDVVSFSGDKLLGGPQAGIVAGRADLIARIRRNPMFRALRVDKMIYGALEATLRHLLLQQWNQIPALNMIMITAEQLRARCEVLAARLKIRSEITWAESVIGGGSTPDQMLGSYVVMIRDTDVVRLERRLRAGDPPVIARIEDGALIIDLRTVLKSEEDELAAVVNDALRS